MKRHFAVLVGVALSALALGCGPAEIDPDSEWDFVVDSAVIAATNPTGASWDTGGGAPDPLACVTVGTSARWCTSVVQDNVNATWDQRAPQSYRYSQLADVRVELLDDDLTGEEEIGTIEAVLQPEFVQETTETLTPDRAPAGWTELTVKLTPIIE